jgi:agmatine deiminase
MNRIRIRCGNIGRSHYSRRARFVRNKNSSGCRMSDSTSRSMMTTKQSNDEDHYDEDDSIHHIPIRRRWFPAEYHRHLACMMIYPHNHVTFRIHQVRNQFLHIVDAIRWYGKEDVIVLCHSVHDYETFQIEIANVEKERRKQSRGCHHDNQEGNVIPLICPSSDAWARDSLPTFVLPIRTESDDRLMECTTTSTTMIGLNWIFNGWGNKIPSHEMLYDIQIKDKVIPLLNDYYYDSHHIQFVPESIPIVLEGGSIHTNGCGTIITTEECLLGCHHRNPTLGKEQIEQSILQATGCQQMIWLPDGLANDHDTNGHIDNFVCFISSNTVVLAWTDLKDEDQENYNRCRTALSILENSTNVNGNPLIVHKVHLPKPIYYTEEIINDIRLQHQQQQQLPNNKQTRIKNDDHDPSIDNSDFDSIHMMYHRHVGQQMAGSYINFYISNHAVLVPQFHDPIYDKKAIETLRPLFPNRHVIGVDSYEILIGGGNIHCMTQQIPFPLESSFK